MKTLHLTLKKKWFDMIASGEKKEEYREIKDYWANRLTVAGDIGGHLFKRFDTVTFRHGYAANAPTIIVECKGIDVGEAVPEWSGGWSGLVFRIKLGNIIP